MTTQRSVLLENRGAGRVQLIEKVTDFKCVFKNKEDLRARTQLVDLLSSMHKVPDSIFNSA